MMEISNKQEQFLSEIEFDQVVKGNVNIKQLGKNKYKITFSKISKFLKYQTWSDSSKRLNDNRSAYYQKAKECKYYSR